MANNEAWTINADINNDPDDPWRATHSGIIHLLKPRPEEINIEDIAHHLSITGRWGGASNEFFSVAQHSIIVSKYCSPENSLWGLLHDAPEAYLGDMIRPMKRLPQFECYRTMETTLMNAICDKFGLAHEMPEKVKLIDNRVLLAEARDLTNQAPLWRDWYKDIEPIDQKIIPWNIEATRELFLEVFDRLTRCL